MAYTEVYVDPSIAGDSGTGTVGDPYGDLQYALDSETHDTTNGTRFNVKAGTDEVLTANLSWATYGTTTFTDDGPFIFQGYTSAAADGGVGGIDGDGSYAIVSLSGADFMYFIDMHLHNTGSTRMLSMDNDIYIYNCEIDNCSHGSPIDMDARGIWINNYFHNLNGSLTLNEGQILFNRFEDGANTFGAGALDMKYAIANSQVSYNVFKLNDTGGAAIEIGSNPEFPVGTIVGNSIYNAAASTQSAIDIESDCVALLIANNLVEGFSGIGGVGINVAGDAHMITGNAFYNCTTNLSGSAIMLETDNESLGASPFGSTTTFQPNDTGNVLSGAWPTADIGAAITYYMDKGAVQDEPSAGGGGGGGPLIGGRLVR